MTGAQALSAAAVAAAAMLAAWGWSRARSAGRRAAEASARAASAAERARVASLARESMAQEASQVIRARIRETARALDAATDPRADESVRRDALRRIGASLAQAEAEVDALLQPPTHTYVARAEHEAALVHHYARTVLEFPGGLVVDLGTPVPPGTLSAVQRELGTASFAVITSDNPMSAPMTEEANALRRGVLGLDLRGAGLAHVPVTGRSPDGSWSEHGFAVAASVAQADALAEVHAQRAYFWFDGVRFALHEAVGERRTAFLPRPGGR